MAAIICYVNTASVGGDGTTNATSGANAAYASLSAAEAAREQNLTDNGGDTLTFLCCGTAADTTGVAFAGSYVTSETCTITIEGDYAVTSGVHWSESYYRLEVSSAIALQVQEDYVYLKKIQAKVTASSGSSMHCFYYNQTIGDIDQCIARVNLSGTAAGNGILCYGGAGDAWHIRNTVIFSEASSSGEVNGIRLITDGTLDVQNCTISGFSTAGCKRSAGTFNVTNCAVFNNADDINGTITVTYSAGDDADFDSGTGNIGLDNSSTSWNANFVSYSTYDFHLISGSSLRDAGTDLSASFPYDVDIDGATRVAWDIGADEYAAATSGNPWNYYAQTA